ncbi:MAG: DNA gyrase C-terminal beta-propeller domain-containing protein, partial [Chloroflexota bacterium]|nr:DNA gyrase C-terminal beta-propeller domain-containing protein [Chloroflexota bacterium]
IIMNLKGDDEVVSVKLAKDDDDIIFVSEQGMGIRFSVNDLPVRRRTAGGVKGMSLRTGDRVVAMDVGNDDSLLMTISKLGRGKVNPLSEYRRQGRGGLGLRAFKLTKNTGLIADAQIVAESKEVYVVSENAQIMRTNLSEIRTLRGRITQGVTIFSPREGDAVSSIACVSELELEEDEKVKMNGSSKKNSSKGTSKQNRGNKKK